MKIGRFLYAGLLLCFLVGCEKAKVEVPVAGAPWLTDLTVAQNKAKAENKPLVMAFTGSDWCSSCMSLEKEVFSQPEFIDYAKKNLVLLQVDSPRLKPQSDALAEQNEKLQDKYGIQFYPTIIVLSPDGKPQGQLSYEEGAASHWIKDLQALIK